VRDSLPGTIYAGLRMTEKMDSRYWILDSRYGGACVFGSLNDLVCTFTGKVYNTAAI